MTIKRATDRLWSGLSTDPKPEDWAPGLLLLETDTGVWWVTGEDRRWMPCYATEAQHQAVAVALSTQTERIDNMQAEIVNLKADIALLKARPGGGGPP